MTSAEFKYLIAINELYNGETGIKLTSIAEKMNVTKVSVFRAAERLEKNGYIKRDEKNKIVLTQLGGERFREYNTLIGWFSSHLQTICEVSAETAYADAIGAVCAFSEETRNAFAQYIQQSTIGIAVAGKTSAT